MDYGFLEGTDTYVIGSEHYNNGTLVNIGKKGWPKEQGYLVYIPDNCNSETKVDFYYPWTDGYYPNEYGLSSSSTFEAYFKQGSDDIIFISKSGNNVYDKNILNNVDTLNTMYGLESKQYNVYGHSKGASAAIEFSTKLVNNNPEIEPINIGLLDPPNNGENLTYTKEQTDALKGKASIFIFNNQGTSNTSIININNIKSLANILPVTLIRAVCKDEHNNHLKVNNEAIANGLFEYFRKRKSVLDNDYIYDYMQLNNNSWVNIDAVDVFNKIYSSESVNSENYYERLSINSYASRLGISSDMISSNSNFVFDNMNNIRSNLNSSANNISNVSSSFSSTTMVPTKEIDLVNEYINSTNSLLNMISEETQSIANAALLFDKYDEMLVDKALNLNSELKDGDNV